MAERGQHARGHGLFLAHDAKAEAHGRRQAHDVRLHLGHLGVEAGGRDHGVGVEGHAAGAQRLSRILVRDFGSADDFHFHGLRHRDVGHVPLAHLHHVAWGAWAQKSAGGGEGHWSAKGDVRACCGGRAGELGLVEAWDGVGWRKCAEAKRRGNGCRDVGERRRPLVASVGPADKKTGDSFLRAARLGGLARALEQRLSAKLRRISRTPKNAAIVDLQC
eukprot:scaffold1144_cov215-Pinguiococcus_pyrenoidosus.AAC.8